MQSLLSINKLRDMEPSGPFGLLVESTAPTNVEDAIDEVSLKAARADLDASKLASEGQGSHQGNLTEACAHLAQKAEDGKDLSIVVQVHGFNNPAKVAYRRYGEAWDYYRKNSGDHVMYVGYRWPGEAMGSNFRSIWEAMPVAATVLLIGSLLLLMGGGALYTQNGRYIDQELPNPYVYGMLAIIAALGALGSFNRIVKTPGKRKKVTTGDTQIVAQNAGITGPLTLLLGCLALSFYLLIAGHLATFDFRHTLGHFREALYASPKGLTVLSPILLGGLLVSLPIVVVLFRILVYFRDAYRAEHFGVPDLVEFVRHLDAELNKALSPYPLRRVSISFIGHSMGALVVTGSVRILTDVFDSESLTDLDSRDTHERLSPEIGKRLKLGNLVLVSPDIPAEAIVSGRANFLSSSVRRFSEAHLFSNQGDVVLECISSIANAFSFPSRTRKHGQRLGNVHITWPKGSRAHTFGLVNKLDDNCLPRSLPESEFIDLLYACQHPLSTIKRNLAKVDHASAIATAVTYFDCTDYRDLDENDALQPVLSYGRRKRFVSILDMACLTINYLRMGWVRPQWRKDVHSAYFDFPFVRSLVYSTALGGIVGAVAVTDKTSPKLEDRLKAFDRDTCDKGLQVLLSDRSIAALKADEASEDVTEEWLTQLEKLVKGLLRSANTIDVHPLSFEKVEEDISIQIAPNPELVSEVRLRLTERVFASSHARELLTHLRRVKKVRIVLGSLEVISSNGRLTCREPKVTQFIEVAPVETPSG